MLWILMLDGDCIAHKFYSKDIDSASIHAKAYANELEPNNNWVCTNIENKNNYHYDYDNEKWIKNKEKNISLISNKIKKDKKTIHQKRCLKNI